MGNKYEEFREEYIAINTGTADNELILKWIEEREGAIKVYRECLKKDNRPYWKGKMGYKQREINSLKKMLK